MGCCIIWLSGWHLDDPYGFSSQVYTAPSSPTPNLVLTASQAARPQSGHSSSDKSFITDPSDSREADEEVVIHETGIKSVP